MSEHATTPHLDTPPLTGAPRAKVRDITGYWVGLARCRDRVGGRRARHPQVDHASVSTVAILVGLMFTFAGIQNIALASMPVTARWCGLSSACCS
jgi:hypothetical protein